MKNKFILLIISFIFIIIFSQGFAAYSQSKKDTNSYVSVVKGIVTLNENLITGEQKYILHSGDKISTKQDSLAVIQWGDGSLTRLGENTKISIEQNQISKDYTDIHISFELLAGKTWSQVISFISKDSSFTQSFSGIEAGVRGTVFDVDLDADFLRVTDHMVTLTQENGAVLSIKQGEVLDITKFSLIEISNFIRNIEDSAWTKLNTSLDREYISELNKKLKDHLSQSTFIDRILSIFSSKYSILRSLRTAEDFEIIEKKILSIPKEKRYKIYNAVLGEYQELNFVAVSDYENYKRKIFYKKALVLLTDDAAEISKLIETSNYDLRDAAENKINQGVEETLYFIDVSMEKVPEINFSFPALNFEYLPDGLQEQFQNDFGNLMNKISKENISLPASIGDLDQAVQGLLDKTLGEMFR